jgi:hypothetical protein
MTYSIPYILPRRPKCIHESDDTKQLPLRPNSAMLRFPPMRHDAFRGTIHCMAEPNAAALKNHLQFSGKNNDANGASLRSLSR